MIVATAYKSVSYVTGCSKMGGGGLHKNMKGRPPGADCGSCRRRAVGPISASVESSGLRSVGFLKVAMRYKLSCALFNSATSQKYIS